MKQKGIKAAHKSVYLLTTPLRSETHPFSQQNYFFTPQKRFLVSPLLVRKMLVPYFNSGRQDVNLTEIVKTEKFKKNCRSFIRPWHEVPICTQSLKISLTCQNKLQDASKAKQYQMRQFFHFTYSTVSLKIFLTEGVESVERKIFYYIFLSLKHCNNIC